MKPAQSKTCTECGATYIRTAESDHRWAARLYCGKTCRQASSRKKTIERYYALKPQKTAPKTAPAAPIEPAAELTIPAHILPHIHRRRTLGALGWPNIVIEP